MARVDDVVAFLLAQAGTMTTYKLHKLLYYAQGHSLAWDGKPLFDAKIKAYENGPCVGSIFNDHRGLRHVSRWESGNADALTADERDTIRAILDLYGNKTSEQLVEQTHAEAPWLGAWTGDRNVAREITVDAMRAFFVTPSAARDARPVSPEAASMASRLTAYLTASSDRGDP